MSSRELAWGREIHDVYDDGVALSTGLVIYTLCIRKKGEDNGLFPGTGKIVY